MAARAAAPQNGVTAIPLFSSAQLWRSAEKSHGRRHQLLRGVLLPLLDTVARVLTAVLLLATLFLVQPMIAISAAVILGGFYAVTFQLLTRKRREVDVNLKTHVGGRIARRTSCLAGLSP